MKRLPNALARTILVPLLCRMPLVLAVPPQAAAPASREQARPPAAETPLPVVAEVPWDQTNPAANLPDDDPDYKAFYRYVPKKGFPELRHRFSPYRKAEKPFEFQKTDYPTGEKNPTAYRFDMGPKDSPVAKGFTRVTREDTFTWQKGWGWEKPPESDCAYRGPSMKWLSARTATTTIG